MSVHDGHRDRLRRRFLEHGLDNFNELNALELLLFYAIPRRDTNPIAHALLDRFGSLQGVFQASVQELCAVEGVGESAAALLTLTIQIVRRSLTAGADKIRYIRSAEDAGEYLLPRFFNERDEVLLLVCLDSQRRIISCQEMGRGVVNAVDTSIRKIAETALKAKASSVILSHNHPDGVALPSAEDDAVTRAAAKALMVLGIDLSDHIIVSGDDYISYRESNALDGLLI